LENLAKKNAPFFPLMGGYQCDALQANGLSTNIINYLLPIVNIWRDHFLSPGVVQLDHIVCIKEK
jgi:hypothetical protein